VAQSEQGARAGQSACDCHAGHRRLLAADHASGPRAAGVCQALIDLLDFIPDFRAEPIEHATNGDVMFVRWIARGTGPKGPFEAVGVDRMIVPNGYVAENLILSDHPIFADFARHVGDLRGA
jgi:hypothetical protein